MQTQRNTVPSLFTIFVGVSVCLLAFDAYSQTARENQSPRLNLASLNTDASAIYFKGKPVKRSSQMAIARNNFFHAGGILKQGRDEASVSDNITTAANNENVETFAMRRDTFTALLSRMLAIY
ncbi:MAG: hypothetical protein AUG51_17515 [Acidobacteria bacterium 13_1_20CM_3_53_8]|nr:MAG: hypothetical protein AUG51_17515 [Acidobacteria bacterium 13_1_20CM_3_53_8]